MRNTLPGMIVDMPIYASHHEPEFFPEPAKFDPERFLKENATDIIPHTYRPFGGIWDWKRARISCRKKSNPSTLKVDRGSASARGSPSPS